MVYLYVGYLGISGLFTNWASTRHVQYDLTDPQQSTPGTFRKVYLSGGGALPDVLGTLYYYQDETMDLLVPWVDTMAMLKHHLGEAIPVKVFLLMEAQNWNCDDGHCLPKDPVVTGFSQPMKEYTSQWAATLAESDHFTISPDAVLINLTEQPREIYWNILMTLALFLGLKVMFSFFVRAKSVGDWWAQVTHKAEM